MKHCPTCHAERPSRPHGPRPDVAATLARHPELVGLGVGGLTVALGVMSA